MTQNARTLLGKSVQIASAGAMSAIARFVSAIVVARVLGPEDSGRVNYQIWLGELLATLVALGLPAAATRYLAMAEGRGDGCGVDQIAGWVARRHLLHMVAGAAVVMAIYCSGVLPFEVGEFFGSIAVFALSSLATGTICILNGRQDYRRLFRFTMVTGVAQVVMVVAGAWIWGAIGAVCGYAGSYLFSAGWFLAEVVRRKDRALAPWRVRELVRFGMSQWLALLAYNIVWVRLEIVFLERMTSTADVGFYTAGLSVVSLATQVPVLLGGAVLAHVAELAGKGDHAEIRRVYRLAIASMAVVLFPACMGLAAISFHLIPVLFGEVFRPAAGPALILALSGLVLIGSSANAVLFALGRPSFYAANGWITAVIALPLFALTIRHFGLFGAASTRLALQSLSTVATFVFLARTFDLRPDPKLLLRIFGSSAAMAVAVWWIGTLRQSSMILFVQIPVGVCMTVALYLLLNVQRAIPLPEAVLKWVPARWHHIFAPESAAEGSSFSA